VQEFPFSEQYDLLQEHFCILEELEQSKDKGDNSEGGDRSVFGHKRRQDRDDNDNSHEMVLEDEEEWSTCDESEDV
jgi:hypothetical protein